MKYRCIIVDDEPPAIKILENYITSLDQLEIVGCAKNAFEALDILNNHKVDLMFLDINMPKLLGTQLIKTLPHPPKIIFTTAHKDFAVEAFELEAFDYLLKPISFERFLKSVNRFCNINSVQETALQQDLGFLYFRSDRKMVKVLLEEILYIESFKDYIVIHRDNKIKIKVKQSISSVERMLPQSIFLRIHRSFIISIKKITAFTNSDVEIGSTTLPFGKSYPNAYKRLTSTGD